MRFDNHPFSEREKEVVGLLLQGKGNKQIALELALSRRTVEFHLINIYIKLGVNSRSEAVLKLTELHLRESTGGTPVNSTLENSSDSTEKVLNPFYEDRCEKTVCQFRLLFDSDLGGDRRAGSEPYWALPTRNGRCMKIGFPIGSRPNFSTIDHSRTRYIGARYTYDRSTSLRLSGVESQRNLLYLPGGTWPDLQRSMEIYR